MTWWTGWRNARSGHGSGFDMIIKIVSLFLIAMVVLAIFGRLRIPKIGEKLGVAKCPDCGRHRIGKGPCECGSDKG